MTTKSKRFNNRAKIFFRAFVFAGLTATQIANAQSIRRSLTSSRLVSADAPSPAVAALEASLPERDIDLFLGKIIRKDNEFVIVYVMSPSKISGRRPIYYSCDAKMRPTAVLENLNIAHKACATFEVIEGSAMVGDVVMVKYMAPKKEETAQEDNPQADVKSQSQETSGKEQPNDSSRSTPEIPQAKDNKNG